MISYRIYNEFYVVLPHGDESRGLVYEKGIITSDAAIENELPVEDLRNIMFNCIDWMDNTRAATPADVFNEGIQHIFDYCTVF